MSTEIVLGLPLPNSGAVVMWSMMGPDEGGDQEGHGQVTYGCALSDQDIQRLKEIERSKCMEQKEARGNAQRGNVQGKSQAAACDKEQAAKAHDTRIRSRAMEVLLRSAQAVGRRNQDTESLEKVSPAKILERVPHQSEGCYKYSKVTRGVVVREFVRRWYLQKFLVTIVQAAARSC